MLYAVRDRQGSTSVELNIASCPVWEEPKLCPAPFAMTTLVR